MKLSEILQDAERLEDFRDNKIVVVIEVDEDNAEAVILGEGVNPKDTRPLWVSQITDENTEVDIDEDLFFHVTPQFWDDAKRCKILWNQLKDE